MRLTTDKGFNCSIDKVYEKLKDLEDIEDKLNIDLITLFKALKDGIYVINAITNKVEKLNGDLIIQDNCLSDINCYDYEDGVYFDNYYFIDYGKTWGLVKEELKK